jgi:hypothetical protein
MAAEATLAGCAEDAAHGTARLTGEADRGAIVVAFYTLRGQ